MFTSAYLAFFRELAEHNDAAWFNENKKLYEKEVKKPFEAFVEQLIAEIQQISPEINCKPSDAIFRINKDVRFSADKTPYKTEMSAAISQYGKKGNTSPGLYLRLGAESVLVGSGVMSLEKEQLSELRYHLAEHLDEFAAIIEHEPFRATFGAVQGDKIKRLPEDLQDAARKQPLLFNTSFYVGTSMPAIEALEPGFLGKVLDLYQLMLPFGMFFRPWAKPAR